MRDDLRAELDWPDTLEDDSDAAMNNESKVELQQVLFKYSVQKVDGFFDGVGDLQTPMLYRNIRST